MSAHEQMRAMLDQLMGTARDGEDDAERLHFSDHRVCRSFLLACCPHDILASTRMDIGQCPKTHDFALRADFEKASAKKDYFYDLDAYEHLARFFDECDRKTEIAKKRLEETQEEVSTEVTEKAEKVLELNESIGKTLAEAERLGSIGEVDQSLKLMDEVEALKTQKVEAETEYRSSMPASSYQQQKLRVCEVCSAYLGIHDNDRRLADHFGGKLHVGFVFLREKYAELKEKAPERRSARSEILRLDPMDNTLGGSYNHSRTRGSGRNEFVDDGGRSGRGDHRDSHSRSRSRHRSRSPRDRRGHRSHRRGHRDGERRRRDSQERSRDMPEPERNGQNKEEQRGSPVRGTSRSSSRERD